MVDPRRGEIWVVDFDPTLGEEIRKTRPAVVISVPHLGILHVRLVIPLTDWKETYSDRKWMTRIDPTKQNGLMKVSAADALHCRSVSLERFRMRIGTVSPLLLTKIADTLGMCIGI